MTRPAASERSMNDRTIVPGEYVLRHADFARIAALLHAEAGIYLPESKATLVYSRLGKRLRALGLESFRDYCALIDSDSGADERQLMLAALTTNVTRFFREPHHFEHLKTKVLPPLLKKAERGGRVRVWSAACSKGHEPYSIAMTILSLMPNAASLDVKILATDIDINVLAHARAGMYDEEARKDIPKPYFDRWCKPVARGERGAWEIGNELRNLISFRELNLIGTWPMKGKFDAILCRNVVIYFDEPTQEKIWNRFVTYLEPESYLYIGHSERVTGSAIPFFAPEGVTTYKKTART
jgi:chemotaxis protein methyltransferase CheR